MIIPSLVGYTSSRRPIYQFDTLDMHTLVDLVSHFKPEDHFDAFAVFSYLQFVYWRRFGEDSNDYKQSSVMFNLHRDHITSDFRFKRRDSLGLTTILNLSHYGRKLCVTYLQELIYT